MAFTDSGVVASLHYIFPCAWYATTSDYLTSESLMCLSLF